MKTALVCCALLGAQFGLLAQIITTTGGTTPWVTTTVTNSHVTLMGGQWGIPTKTWSAPGVEAGMMVYLCPVAECDQNYVLDSAEWYLQTGTGLVPVMNQPRDFASVASLQWYDFIDTSRINNYHFFRNHPANNVVSGCDQRGTWVMVMLRISSTESFRIRDISGGAISNDDDSTTGNLVYYSFSGLPGYSDYIYGVAPNGDVLNSGESSDQKVSELYYAGFWFSNQVWSQREIDNQRDYIANRRCSLVSVWYQVVGVSRNVIYEGRIDLPVGQTGTPNFPMHFTIGKRSGGKVPVTIKPGVGAGEQVVFVESAPKVTGPWSLYNGNLLPWPAGTYWIPASGTKQFFRLRQ